MSRPQLEKRPRILVIEDIPAMRESYTANLEIDGLYYIDGVSNLEDAIAAVDRRTYHVALVDIMLAGAKDRANRDGVKVLDHLHKLGEGTRSIVLSVQDETQLVRDLFLEFDAFEYVDKKIVASKGFSAISEAIEKALKRSPVDAVQQWSDLAEVFSGGWLEAKLVEEIMRGISFRGGYENLSRSLISVARYIQPLLPSVHNNCGLRFQEDRGVFTGTFWSKGQGCAVELTVGGSGNKDRVGREQSARDTDATLVDREKAGLRVVVTKVSERLRGDFLGPT